MDSSSTFAMTRAHRAGAAQRGVTLIEVMIALLVLAFGLLGAAGLLVRAQQGEFESYQRKQALMMIENFVARMQANRPVADECYAKTNAATGAPSFGTATTLPQPFTCTAGSAPQQNAAIADLTALQNALLGAGETDGAGGPNVGALSNARGCVSVTGTETTGFTFKVSVAWQGTVETSPPAAMTNCGTGLYSSENLRRAISVSFYVPYLL